MIYFDGNIRLFSSTLNIQRRYNNYRRLGMNEKKAMKAVKLRNKIGLATSPIAALGGTAMMAMSKDSGLKVLGGASALMGGVATKGEYDDYKTLKSLKSSNLEKTYQMIKKGK